LFLYADIVAENIDKKVLESKALYPELRSWFRLRDDTFALWRGTEERLHSFFNTLNSFDSYLQFTTEVGGSSLSFLDLFITIEEGRLETSVCSKPTDAHLYLNGNSCHPRSQILGIAKGVALRLRRICSKEQDFRAKSAEYANYLIECGHGKEHVLDKFREVGNISREDARKSKKKSNEGYCCLVTKYNPRGQTYGKS
jgi:hypothetical protein